ncbi:Holliday junction branch migration DNA helicase RuvB [Candidatus Shapirobacteria bacterium CG09_land_8_20_14_0_10_38_17]|uniref:Holliday junction branch migration complex subunit RuvB n=1 Tax=Candidatus Shapirobacteria bacterium CG09_land_8_20_14_0_10_38_17 TaxID=1974884 RepID=A0A2H0WTZ7_9BACT|nr:MAG: Holliday junction branch migration DNA helicase RuvB [Candidatus Shapirobacteria bacterium CG09_land_8_20_14_0_10_38_17]
MKKKDSSIYSDSDFNLLRPKFLKDFIGQDDLKKQLRIFIAAALGRKEPLEHVLFYGPPGLGKTTLAGILAQEMGTGIRITSGPALSRAGDLASILTNLKEGDILFIDEIHRLNKVVEETLYPAMEDYALNIIIGKGPSAHSIRLKMKKFTIVGATTRIGLISSPMRDRFGFVYKLDFYQPQSLAQIVLNSARILKIDIDKEGALEIARRSRGTPRIANRLLKRARDFAQIKEKGIIDINCAKHALESLDVDGLGLNDVDRKLLELILKSYKGGPVGIDNLAAGLIEDVGTIVDVYEPYLMKLGFLKRTPRGRVITEAGKKHLGEKGALQPKLV